MAETPNRFERESEMARALGKMGARHKREFLALLGNPPDQRNVPENFWQRVQEETDAEILAVLLLIFMESAILHGLDEIQAAPLAREWAQTRASETAAGFVRHSQELFRRAETLTRETQAEARAEFPGQPGPAIERGHEMSLEIYQRTAGDVFGPERMGRVAQFETAMGMDRGGQAAIRVRQVVVTVFWRHSEIRPTGHAGAEKLPCPVCTPNLDKPEDEWTYNGRPYPEGPPMHPNCDCFREYIEDHTGLVIGENYGGASTAKRYTPHLIVAGPHVDSAAIDKMFRELTGREPTAEDQAECARIDAMTDEEFDAYDAKLRARGE